MLGIKNIIITPEILQLIAEVDEFKGRWQAIKNLAPERLDSLRRVATIESVGSSTRIEGAKLTDAEVEQLLSKLETQSFTNRDEQEVAGYADAMNMIIESYEAITPTKTLLNNYTVFCRNIAARVRNTVATTKRSPIMSKPFPRTAKVLASYSRQPRLLTPPL